jgi:Family of unknown function (DUF5772)
MWGAFYTICGVASLSVAAVLIHKNYEGFWMLYSFHRVKEKSLWKSVQKTIKTVAWMGYLVAYQKVVKNVECVGKNEYDIHYVLGSRLYKIRVYNRKGPVSKNVLQVIDENQKDVTNEVSPYLGPLEDWHGQFYCPSRLHHESLTFNLSDGSCKTFQKDEAIRVGLRYT